mgnify:CR=1 FL=1
MDKYKTFINNIINRYEDWAQEEFLDKMRLDEAFTMEEQTIIHLNRRVESANGLINGKDVLIDERDEKIAELNEKIKLKDARMQKELDYKVKKANQITKLEEEISNKKMQIDKLWEHIDCLENNPFRRIYNWVTGIVKYRIKLVKVGDNK